MKSTTAREDEDMEIIHMDTVVLNINFNKNDISTKLNLWEASATTTHNNKKLSWCWQQARRV